MKAERLSSIKLECGSWSMKCDTALKWARQLDGDPPRRRVTGPLKIHPIIPGLCPRQNTATRKTTYQGRRAVAAAPPTEKLQLRLFYNNKSHALKIFQVNVLD